MVIPAQWYQSFSSLFLFGWQEIREEERSRVVRIRSSIRRKIASPRTGFDSRKLDKLVLHFALLSSASSVGLRKSFHFCLLYQFLMRFCMELSTDISTANEFGSCGCWI